MIRKEIVTYGENLRGGKGKVEMRHIVTEEELLGHGKLYARIILPPHASIGYHQHVGNTEPYLILRGKGIFTDNDGTATEVGPGDVCVIEVGQSHGMENNSDVEELEFVALIYNDKAK